MENLNEGQMELIITRMLEKQPYVSSALIYNSLSNHLNTKGKPLEDAANSILEKMVQGGKIAEYNLRSGVNPETDAILAQYRPVVPVRLYKLIEQTDSHEPESRSAINSGYRK